jgi:hypothetical protein
MRNTPDHEIVSTEPDAAARFAERLAELDVEQWLTVAFAAEADASARSTPLALLDALLTHLGLRVAAWSVMDDVATCAHYSVDHASRQEVKKRVAARLVTARNAANAAALALLLRPILHPGDFDVLYRPFATLVPP